MRYLIVGLGNPGKEYSQTRHNVGVMVLERLLADHPEDLPAGFQLHKKFNALLADGQLERRKVVLLFPQTFMNLSGEAVSRAAAFYKIAPANVLVIFDDKDLPLGKLRLRAAGSAGGHNGMKSVLAALGTEDVPRLRLGIGAETGKEIDAAKFVLGKLTKRERETLDRALLLAAKAVSTFIREGIEAAMNKFN